jgi:hypothetical protein
MSAATDTPDLVSASNVEVIDVYDNHLDPRHLLNKLLVCHECPDRGGSSHSGDHPSPAAGDGGVEETQNNRPPADEEPAVPDHNEIEDEGDATNRLAAVEETGIDVRINLSSDEEGESSACPDRLIRVTRKRSGPLTGQVLRLRGGCPDSDSKKTKKTKKSSREKVDVTKYSTTVNKGMAKCLPCNNRSDEAREENVFCCCLACAVRMGRRRCECSKCAIFRDRRKRDKSLGVLVNYVEEAIESAEVEVRNFKKKQRQPYVMGILGSGVKSFTAGGYARVWYEVGASGKRVAVCQKVFAQAYGLGIRTIERVIRGIAKEKLLKLVQRPLTDRKLVEVEMLAAMRQMADKVGITLTAEEEAAMQVSSSAKQNTAAAWIRRYASLHGDLMPDGDNEWHLDPVDLKVLHDEYVEEVKNELKETPLGLVYFYQVWESFCSNVKVREFKNVTGKCATCANFSEMRKKSNSVEARAEIVACWLFHRATFSRERMAYHDRRLQATSRPTHYWSFIGDGMQQVC